LKIAKGDEYAWEQAAVVYDLKNWLSFDVCYDIPSSINNEEELIKKDLFSKLSKESKSIVKLIFCSDDDILRMLSTPKTGRISRRSLMIFLQEMGYPVRTIARCFKELKQLVSEF
jgi:hypothetical protein